MSKKEARPRGACWIIPFTYGIIKQVKINISVWNQGSGYSGENIVAEKN